VELPFCCSSLITLRSRILILVWLEMNNGSETFKFRQADHRGHCHLSASRVVVFSRPRKATLLFFFPPSDRHFHFFLSGRIPISFPFFPPFPFLFSFLFSFLFPFFFLSLFFPFLFFFFLSLSFFLSFLFFPFPFFTIYCSFSYFFSLVFSLNSLLQ
jgi:hypothetical protein